MMKQETVENLKEENGGFPHSISFNFNHWYVIEIAEKKEREAIGTYVERGRR